MTALPDPICLESMCYEAGTLITQHPPVLRLTHKRMVFEMCCTGW